MLAPTLASSKPPVSLSKQGDIPEILGGPYASGDDPGCRSP